MQPITDYLSLRRLVLWYQSTPPELQKDGDFADFAVLANTAIDKLLPLIPELASTTHLRGDITIYPDHIHVDLVSDTEVLEDGEVQIFPTSAG